MILKNCLPFTITINYVDSSNVKSSITLAKDEEKYLFCFNMASTVIVDIILQDFLPVNSFKLFDLKNYKRFENRITIYDRYKRQSAIYTQI